MGDKGVSVTPADVRAIANRHIAKAKDDIAVARANFEKTADGGDGFGAFEAGTELAGLHTSVKSVFTKTVDGVTTDLSTYHQNLIAGANAWDAADQQSADRSRVLVDRLSAAGQQPMASEDNFNSSRQAEGERLGLGDALSAVSEHTDDSVGDDGSADTQPAAQTAAEPAAQPSPGQDHSGDEF